MSNNYQFMKLGDILVKEDIITQSDLDKALVEQKDTREKLGHVLIKQGSIGEDDLVKAFSLQLGHEHILEEDMFLASEDVVQLIPEDFAIENNVLALNKSGDTLVVAMEDPEDLAVLDSLKDLTSLNIVVRVAGSSSIKSAIDKHYGKIKKSDEVESAISNISIIKGAAEGEEELDLATEEVSAKEAPFVKLVNLILNEAIKEDSSDIHIEPGREHVTVRIRVDGVLLQIMTPPMSSLNGMVTRIKILSKLNIAEHRLPQDGRLKIKLIDRDIDVRVSVLPTVHGEKVVLRLLGNIKQLTLTNLGFPESKLKIFRKWIRQPYGMIIISGPTGSGKSTTLYAALQEIYSVGINITTVEDPVEYQIPGINQVQMHDDIGLTFTSSLRSILRQDPDVLLIGEIRDKETADIAVKFSLTGHLVFSTVHANDAPSTIARLLDLGVPPFLLGSSLNIIMAQRLVRTIDSDAKEEYKPEKKELDLVSFPKDKLTSTKFYKGAPKSSNHNTGYKGRTAIHEIMEINSSIRNLIYKNANQDALIEQAKKNGMTTLREAGILKVISGETTISEILRSTVQDS